MGFSKKPNTPKMKFGMERSSKMKVVCTWGFSLIVDIGEVIEVISLGGSVGLTRNLLVVIIFKFRQNSFAKI
jgi:hypothetical protein